MQRILTLFIFVALFHPSFSQGTYIPFGSDAYPYIERLDIKYSKLLPFTHTGDKPFLRSKGARIAEALILSNLTFDKVERYELQYLMDDNAEWLDSMKSITHPRPLWKVLYREPATLAQIESKPKGLFDVRFNPMLELHLGGESFGGRFLFTRSLGVEVRGNIKHVFSFYFNATGNSARNPGYVEVLANNKSFNSSGGYIFHHAYVPGTAYWKDYSSSKLKFPDGVDYFDARGYINMNILKYINLSFGRDKNFIGNGIRSLFLSDNAAPYLFLKLNVDLSRFHYQSIFAELTSEYLRGADQLLPKKYMATHHLSIEITHWMDLGLFESVIMSRSNHFELQYLNPIIFYRAVEHALGSPDNELIGGDFKINVARHAQFYGQFLLDEFNFSHFFKHDGWWANKWGIQLGAKYMDLLPHLDAQIEFNVVRPYTYSHTDTIDNYTHYNQALAHPLGANFMEFIISLRYQPIPRLTFDLKFITARMGDDTTITGIVNPMYTYGGGDFGGDILKANAFVGGGSSSTTLNNRLFQGAKGTLNLVQLVTSYRVWHNVYLDGELTYRSRTSTKTDNNYTFVNSTFIFQIGARWNVPYKRNLF